MARCKRFPVITTIAIVAAVGLMLFGATMAADRTPEQAAKYAIPEYPSLSAQRPDKPATAPQVPTKRQPQSMIAGAQEGGETCASAVVISALPYTDQGFTCDNTDDDNAICPFSTPGSPDVMYSYTPAANEVVDITLCDTYTDYDTKLYVFENSCGGYNDGTDYACNDDACPGFVSEILGLSLTGGNTYYIVVDGYASSSCGNYQIDIAVQTACIITCPGGATAEGETGCGLAGADINGGCNSTVPVWSPIACGETVCGTAWTEFNTGTGLDNRDTDWYEKVFTEPTDVTWTVEANFPVLAFIIDGNGGCAGLNILTSGTGNPCDVVQLTATVCPGTYWFWVGPSSFTGLACADGPWEYTATLDCVPGAAVTNDACVDQEAIGDVTDMAFSTSCASFDGPGLCQTSNNIWYCYTAQCDGDITVSLCGSSYDTKLAVYDGCGCSGPVAPNKQGNDVAIAGTQEGGEDIAGAVVIPSLPYSDQGFTCDNLDDYNAVCPYSTPGSPDVVYSYTPASNEIVDITLCDAYTTYDTKLYVFDAPPAAYDDGSDIACNDDECPGWVSELIGVSMTGGTTYYIVVDGYAGSSCGDYQIDIAVQPPPPLVMIGCNDDFCSLQSELTFAAVGGQSYLIEIGGYSTASGDGLLSISNSNVCGPGVIPTLTEWGMIVVGLILFGFLAWYVRRRQLVTA